LRQPMHFVETPNNPILWFWKIGTAIEI
jgi:hypothetical protein